MPSRDPRCCSISWNAYQICHHESHPCHLRWMCSAWDSSNYALLRARQKTCYRRRPDIPMEPGHLLHSALTRPSNVDARRLKSRHPFVPAAQQLISFFWQQHYTCGAVGGSSFECRVGGQPQKAPHLNYRHQYAHTHTLGREWPSQEEPGSGSTASAPVSDISAPACTNGVWPPLRSVSVAHKNKRRPCHPPMSNPSTPLSPPWTAWPDGSGRWGNRMAAQNMPQI